MNNSICINLTSDEACVLFEFLTRFGSTDQLSIEDQAEAIALWNLQCLLEKQSLVPLDDDSDWSAVLPGARARLRDSE